MKKGLCLISALLSINNLTYAVNPVQGWYAGVYLDVSYAPNMSINFARVFNVLPAGKATITRSVLGGVGGEVGYRYENYRVEGQLMYNNNPYSSLTINNVTVNGTSATTNVATSNNTYERVNTSLTMNGQTNTGAFLINAMYDLYNPTQDNVSPFVPYVGLGIGYAYVQNNIQFEYNNTPLYNGGSSGNFSTGAGQGIIGFNYFLDDFTTMGLRFRYFSTMDHTKTSKTMNTFSSRETLYNIGLMFNGAFDFG